MSKKDAVTLLIVLGVGGYSYYASETGTGPIAWLSYAQRAIFGSYSDRLSFALALILVGVLAALGSSAWKKVFKSRDGDEQSVGFRILFGPRATPSAAPALQGRMILQLLIFFLVATWTIGFALYWWYATEQRGNAGAQYAPIDLSDGALMHEPQGSHIELRGGVPLENTLIHEEEEYGTGNQFVPVVSRGWVKGQAVTFVVKVKDHSELTPTKPDALGNQAATSVLMARIDGPVPGPVVLEFKKLGVKLGESNYLLRPVKTRDARAITESIESRFMFFLVACGFLSALFCVFAGMQWIMRKHSVNPTGKV